MGCLSSKPKEIPKTETTIRAILLIQRWYRRHVELMEERRKFTWQIFQKLEYADEQDELKLYNFYIALMTYIPTSSISRRESIVASTDFDDIEIGDVDDEYEGIHLHTPLRRTDLDALIDTYRKKKQARLHPKYVADILKASITKLKKLPNINEASTSISRQITIVGDLHGKLDDLLVIFHKNGLPSSGNPYVFNGDFVDRGKKGLEVFLILLSCFLVFPGSVFLNRGNHEDHLINLRYGFIGEVNRKYKTTADRLLKLIEGVYRWLPLGTMVNSKVLIVHGGISDTTDLDILRDLNRSKYVSLLRPPMEGSAISIENIDKEEWKQIFDILWSDPMEENGCVDNTIRGAGMCFGPDVTKNFLAKYNLMYIVRSHECKPEGYDMQHEDKLLTIFSASNYYELGSNRGAYLKLIGIKLQTQFVEYSSALSKLKKLNIRQQVGLVEASAIKELSKQILASKDDLEQEFLKYDPKKTGVISIANWCNAIKTATGLAIDWNLLGDKLVKMDTVNQLVIYMTTFDGFSPEVIKSHSASKSVVETLYQNKSNLETIFRIIDKDNSGYISIDEFAEACNLLRKHMPNPMTQDQMIDICKMMDINKDGVVTLNEFLETFRLVSQKFQKRPD